MDNTQPLEIPGARGTVKIQGAQGIFFKILVDGEVVKPHRGAWKIAMRNGTTSELRAKGFLPGFQKLYVGDDLIFTLGASVGLVERIVMFLPILLVVFSWVGIIVALMLFFMNITVVKNTDMPRPLRIALPIVNTLAGAFLLWVISNSIT